MEINIKTMPIKILDIGDHREVDLDIGGTLARIIEPKPILLEAGIVHLAVVNLDGPYWERLISVKLGDRVLKGCTDDPRIVEIAKKATKMHDGLTQKDIGKVYPPLETGTK